jgi:hypothetical protein
MRKDMESMQEIVILVKNSKMIKLLMKRIKKRRQRVKRIRKKMKTMRMMMKEEVDC